MACTVDRFVLFGRSLTCTSGALQHLELCDCGQWQAMGHFVDSTNRGTTVAAPPSFRLGSPALCGSHSLVISYYCRLGELLCFVFISVLIVFFC